MCPEHDRQSQVAGAARRVTLQPEVAIRMWVASDQAAIERLSTAEGWPTPRKRPADTRDAWDRSWPTLVAVHRDVVIGFLRAVTDGAVTTYIAEILVDPAWRGKGIGLALVETCHYLCPWTRLDLLSTEQANGFYDAVGFRRFQGYRKSFT